MKRFIVIRHGNYDENTGRLDAFGRGQMTELAGELKPYLVGPIRVLSSTARRALDSAEALTKAIGHEGFESHLVLWCDDRHPQDEDGAMKLIKEKSAGVETLIVVTHLEHAESLPSRFGREVLKARIDRRGLNKGWAFVVLCDEKTGVLVV